MKLESLFVLIFLSPILLARERIVYGNDNRVETFEANKAYQDWAKSTAGMISSIKLLDIGSHYIMPPSSLGKDYRLCDGERFKEQPSPLSCSGFLIGSNLLVTAGHCVRNQKSCEDVSWVFDFKIDAGKSKAKVAVSKDNVYKCSTVIDVKLQGQNFLMRDYALIKLDRNVISSHKERLPLRYRKVGKINDREELVLIGHPSGLPQKISPKGFVYHNESEHYFKTNLDSFGGNSGSAVFNARTGLVEGILVRGATDYIQDHCGTKVNKVDEEDAKKENLGEAVSRITDIDALKDRLRFLQAISLGNTKIVNSILSAWDQEFMLQARDDKGNTALHLAIINGGKDVFDLLIKFAPILDLNVQNYRGETPLHMAAFVNNARAIRTLVKLKVNALIKDNIGDLPSQRTSFLSFRLRSFLRNYERLLRKKIN